MIRLDRVCKVYAGKVAVEDLSLEIPEVDSFVGLDELENAPAAAH